LTESLVILKKILSRQGSTAVFFFFLFDWERGSNSQPLEPNRLGPFGYKALARTTLNLMLPKTPTIINNMAAS
jgi:hypothetical protein